MVSGHVLSFLRWAGNLTMPCERGNCVASSVKPFNMPRKKGQRNFGRAVKLACFDIQPSAVVTTKFIVFFSLCTVFSFTFFPLLDHDPLSGLISRFSRPSI